MPDLSKNIDAQAGLAGTNKLEILMFRLGKDSRTGREETFGINALKVREVMRSPAITHALEVPALVEGMVSLRGVLMPVIDLAKCVGIETDGKPETMIITEFNGQMQGFLVKAMDNVLHLDSAAMRAPSELHLAGMRGLIAALADSNDGRQVMMLDVERILAEIGYFDSDEMVFKNVRPPEKEREVFSSGDSLAVRDQIARTLEVAPAEKRYAEEILDGSQDVATDQIDVRSGQAESKKIEILLFGLGGSEKFGVNVFKVKEVCPAGKITRTPNMPAGVDGVVLLHGHVMPVLNLAGFMGVHADENHRTMIVTEFNNQFLGVLVQGVDRVIRVDTDRVHAAAGGRPDKAMLITTIVEQEDGSLISILDVEQILAHVFGVTVVGKIE